MSGTDQRKASPIRISKGDRPSVHPNGEPALDGWLKPRLRSPAPAQPPGKRADPIRAKQAEIVGALVGRLNAKYGRGTPTGLSARRRPDREGERDQIIETAEKAVAAGLIDAAKHPRRTVYRARDPDTGEWHWCYLSIIDTVNDLLRDLRNSRTPSPMGARWKAFTDKSIRQAYANWLKKQQVI